MSLGITVEFSAEVVKFSQRLDKLEAKMDNFRSRDENSSAKISSMFLGLVFGCLLLG